MRFEVPQFIDVEDKIFGPFTWKQFVYLAGGAGMIFILFITLPFILFLVFATPIGIFVAGLAFYQVNNRPFIFLIEAITTYFTRSRLYLWKKEPKVSPTRVEPEASEKTFVVRPKNTIFELSRKLEFHALIKK